MAWLVEDRRREQVGKGEPLVTAEVKAYLREKYFPRYPTKRAVLLPALHHIQHTYGWIPAQAVKGVVLAEACSWRELEVVAIDSTPPRSRIDGRVIHSGSRRDFIGFNRARHAVLETAIYATRVHLLPRDFLLSEIDRLQVIVDKTAGPREFEAMTLLADYIRKSGDHPGH